MAAFFSTKANTCASADTLSTSGGLVLATFSGGEHWFKITSAKPINAFYGHWLQNQRAPKTLQVYSGTCSSLSLLYTQQFDTIADTINQFVHAFAAGTYFIKISGFDGNNIGLSASTEALGDNCPSPDCNLVPNFSFEDHPAFPSGGAAIQWGAFEAWANCWANGSSHPGATPDYAIEPNNSASGGSTWCSGQGNECKVFPGGLFQTWPNTASEHATAHIFIMDTLAPNRREYILTNLQDNQGVTALEPNRNYYISMRVRNSPTMRFHNDALGVMFTDQLYIEPTNSIYTPSGGINTVYQSLTGVNTVYNNNNWRQCNTFLQNDGTPKSHLIIGNFENNTTTASRNLVGNIYAGNNLITGQAMRFASIYIDHVQVLEMPDAGADLTVCEGEEVILGYEPACLPTGITYQWWDALYTTLLATTPTLTVSALQGQTTYMLEITFDGLSSFSTVTVTGLAAAHLNVSATNQTVCNGHLSLLINDYDPNDMSYSYTTTGLNGSGQIDGNGNLDFGSVEFTNPLGMATITVIATNNTTECHVSQTFTVYDCCNEQPSGIPVYNERFSAFNQGTSGQNYIIYGSVLLDDNYAFTDCHFYLQPDAELVAMADLNITFQNCTFQACNEFKWDRIFNEHASTSITFTDCQIGEGLRAVHSENDAQLSLSSTLLFDNTLSQLVRSYANGSALSWQSNTYNMYPLNSITQQHPLSTIPMGSILNLNGYSVVGIKYDEAQNFSLANGNTFWADFSGSFDNYLHVWLAQNSIASSIDGNTFNEGMNVYIQQNSTATITDNYFQKSAQTNGAPGGVYAHGSTVIIGDLSASPFSNYLFDGAGIVIENPIETYIYKNQILHNTLSEAIKVYATTLTSSRTLIHENEITAKTCILINNLKSDWQLSSNQKVYVHDNDLFPTKSSNTTGNGNIAVGVSATNCEGISIGENTVIHVYATGVTLPDATNNYQSVGVYLADSRNAFVGCNDILFAGRALAFSGDVTRDAFLEYNPSGSPVFPIQFQSNTFSNYYFGIYVGIGTTISSIGQNINNKELAADNEWLQIIGLPISSADRVKDDRVNQGSGDYINYYYSGATNSGNTKFPDAPNSSFVLNFDIAFPNNCLISVPSNKSTLTPPLVGLMLYPNPVDDALYYSITTLSEQQNNFSLHISIVGVDGKIHIEVPNASFEGLIDVERLPSGMYVFKANSGRDVYVGRFVRF